MNCYICEKEIKKKKDIISEILYDTPWQDKGEVAHFCSEGCFDKLFDHFYSDFRYFYCDSCKRLICEQNPSNGWHVQVRHYNGALLCLRCFKNEILENGTNPEYFKKGELIGMFFDVGNPELLQAGYKEYRNYYIHNDYDALEACKSALSKIEQGYKVVVAYEALGIGGSEGYITLYIKK